MTVQAVSEQLPPQWRSPLGRRPARSEAPSRTELIERHLPLARRLARRYAHTREASDDLTQIAALGLVKAVDRFDPERGTSFTAFAVPTILGELKRHFRDTRWALHVPRELQERFQMVERKTERMSASLGRAPTAGEVARALDLQVEQVLEAQAAAVAYDAVSLDAPVGRDPDDGVGGVDLLGECDAGYELVEDRAAIMPALEQLTARDRLVLRLRFNEEMTQAEIGARLGVSQMQVSRILRRALSRARELADGGPRREAVVHGLTSAA